LETRPGTCWALRNGTVNAANDPTSAPRLDLFAIPRGSAEIGWSGDDPSSTARAMRLMIRDLARGRQGIAAAGDLKVRPLEAPGPGVLR